MTEIINCFVNKNISLINNINNKMVKISWRGGYEYKRIDNREETENKRKKTNLYVDST